METVKLDYAPKGVQFFYIYKPLAHPELNNYVSPFTIGERIMHVREAKRRLGSSITWLADTMDNVYHEAMGQTPNSELIIAPDGRATGVERPGCPPAVNRSQRKDRDPGQGRVFTAPERARVPSLVARVVNFLRRGWAARRHAGATSPILRVRRCADLLCARETELSRPSHARLQSRVEHPDVPRR